MSEEPASIASVTDETIATALLWGGAGAGHIALEALGIHPNAVRIDPIAVRTNPKALSLTPVASNASREAPAREPATIHSTGKRHAWRSAKPAGSRAGCWLPGWRSPKPSFSFASCRLRGIAPSSSYAFAARTRMMSP